MKKTPARGWFGLFHFWDCLPPIFEFNGRRPRRSQSRRKKSSYQPEIEGLESRQLLAGQIWFGVIHWPVESEGLAHVSVFHSRPLGDTEHVTVDFSTSDDTAEAGFDYVAASGTLDFGTETIDGGWLGFDVIIINDPWVDWYFTERLFVSLFNAVNATVMTPSGDMFIEDDDPIPTVQFSSPLYSVAENAGSATVTLVTSGAWEKESHSVNYETYEKQCACA